MSPGHTIYILAGVTGAMCAGARHILVPGMVYIYVHTCARLAVVERDAARRVHGGRPVWTAVFPLGLPGSVTARADAPSKNKG